MSAVSPRLADDYDKRIRVEDGVPVAEFRGVFDFDRKTRQFFNVMLPDKGGVPRCAASRDYQSLDAPEVGVR